MSRRLRVALGVLGVLQLLGVAACFLLSIWEGDDRWGATAFLLLCTGLVTFAVATFPGLP